MPQSSREIRRRIKSVKNIGQITKAMELVSASKMRKAQLAASSSRPYAKLSSEIVNGLLGKVKSASHPILNRQNPIGKIFVPQHRTLAILITPDRGLAGSLSTNVIASAAMVARHNKPENVDFVAVGRKGTDALRRMGMNLAAVFSAKDKGVTVFDAKPIAKIAIDDYLNFKYDKVYVVFTDFVSTLVQQPKMIQLLPLAKPHETENVINYEFEPDEDEVLENLVYRYIEFAVFQALLEAAASEHSARMVAMRNANQAASDLIDDLVLSANQARQSGITRELSEISAAKLAMEG